MDKLLQEIAIEKEYIEKTLHVLYEALERPEQTTIELSAIGACLHHSYNGIENILKRILKLKKVSLPSSASSHKDLLNKAVSQKILSEELSEKLDKYRGFRHFFVHAYGVLLDKEALLSLAKTFPEIWKQFEGEVDEYLQALSPSQEIEK